MSPHRIASVPASYGAVEDGALCRHVRVPHSVRSLDALKAAVLAAYEDQYSPHEVTLYTRRYDDDPRPITTDRLAAAALSYAPDWTDLAIGDTHREAGRSTLLIVSAMCEDESELLIVPACHSAPHASMAAALAHPEGAARDALPLIRRLDEAQPGLFDPLPLPGHIDDWLAQFREASQSVSELLASGRQVPSAARRTIYLQPLSTAVAGTQAEAAERRSYQLLRGFLAAFFHGGAPVSLLPTAPLSVDRIARRARALGKSIGWRDRVPANGTSVPWGQLSAPQLLNALKPKALRGKGGGRSLVGGALPPDGFCVLGVTMADLFCDADDVFVGGLACMVSRAGIFSFARYAKGGVGAGLGGAGLDDVALHRACKTAAHEALHMFGIGHCVHRSCLMNGSGHLLEDFAAPSHLCPVDLAKLDGVLGCPILPRYRALLAFCEARVAAAANGPAASPWAEHAAWLQRAISVAEGASASVSKRPEGAARASTAGSGRVGKRKRK